MAGALSGKIAVITGAAAGMGRASAELFVSEGAQVVLADILEDSVCELAGALGDPAVALRCDVTNEADIKAAVALAESRFGGVDILFNNAGVGAPPHLVDTVTDETWDRTMALLVKSVLWGIRHATPAMRKRGGGSIVNTGSLAGARAGFGTTAYSVAKAAVSQLSRLAASELATDGIRVNTILPGLIASSIFGTMSGLKPDAAARMGEIVQDEFRHHQPLRRAGLPIDIAQACLFLASDASAFVTGTEMVVDGGMFLQGPPSLSPYAERPLATILANAAGEAATAG